MGINSVDYSSLFQNYRVPNIPVVSVDEIKRQEEERRAQESTQVSQSSYSQPAVREDKPNAQLEDISLTFNKKDDFSFLGKDSDIEKLDMQKAVSDVQKDSILKDYQYFVGSSRNLVSESADGMVFAKF